MSKEFNPEDMPIIEIDTSDCKEYKREDYEVGKIHTCKTPPEGWYCTIEEGHSGPCAAYPDGFDDTNIDLLFTCGTFDTNDCVSAEDICKLLDKTDNWEEWIASQIKQEGIEKYLEWYEKMSERHAVCEELIEAHNKLFNNIGETK